MQTNVVEDDFAAGPELFVAGGGAGQQDGCALAEPLAVDVQRLEA